MTLQQIIIAILQALLALARTPTAETDSIEKQKADLQLRKDELNTFAQDSEFNSDEVQEVINDLTEVLASSTPHDDYAEVPADSTETVEGKTEPVKEEPIEDDLDKANREEQEAEEMTIPEAQPEPEPETPREKRLREKAEVVAAATAAAKATKRK